MNIKEIIGKYLTDNGFDGLYMPGECGCQLGDDFMPCDTPNAASCEPAYKWLCKEVRENGSCPGCDNGTIDADDDFCMGGKNWRRLNEKS